MDTEKTFVPRHLNLKFDWRTEVCEWLRSKVGRPLQLEFNYCRVAGFLDVERPHI